MPVLYVLDAASRQEFADPMSSHRQVCLPPKLVYQERKVFFALPVCAQEPWREIHLPVNKMGFLLQLGYFKASGRFFKISTFKQIDKEYIARIYGFDLELIHWRDYHKVTASRHRSLILEQLGGPLRPAKTNTGTGRGYCICEPAAQTTLGF